MQIESKFWELVLLVQQTRFNQKKYFSTRERKYLEASKKMEKELDKFLNNLDYTTKTIKPSPGKQKNLFD